MIENIETIIRNNSFFTPAISQVNINDGSSIVLDESRLMLKSPQINKAAIMADAYAKSLPFIKCNAIGLNFEFRINDYEFNNWVRIENLKKFPEKKIGEIGISIKIEENLMPNIQISILNEKSADVRFNFHYPIEMKTFSDIDFNLIDQSKFLHSKALELISQLF
ncbi:hypothetical protein [Leptospira noguchii]|uniref:hypothetical protein n=1 Tax=Leptospira noguchii TaxID=28182 RepID=UPI0012FE60AC|nr:hypothetical protein [Leptospira noguchii]